MRFVSLRKWIRSVFFLSAALTAFPLSYAQDGSFKNFEIRVIKNRFFEKHMRLEAGLNASAIMNRTFNYSYLSNATAAFHITESIGVFGEGAYVASVRKSDCNTLGSQFEIEPILEQVNWFAGGGVVVTPIYGKFQMSNGEVLYFDWFFTVGGGTSDVSYRKDKTCIGNDNGDSKLTTSRSQFNFGTGQRFFLNKNVSLNWALRFLNVQPIKLKKDAKNNDVLDDSAGTSTLFSEPNQHVMLGLGASYFL